VAVTSSQTEGLRTFLSVLDGMGRSEVFFKIVGWDFRVFRWLVKGISTFGDAYLWSAHFMKIRQLAKGYALAQLPALSASSMFDE